MAQRWLESFLDYIGNLSIVSKELDYGADNKPAPLLDVLYGAQYRFLEQVCSGLDAGVHSFVCLKARQLGISTISLAVDCFWLSVHDGLQGALITDTDANKEKFRIMLRHYLETLPPELRVKIVKENRNNLVLANGSVLDYVVAGTRKGNHGQGRSRAWNFVHATEVSSWGSAEGVASLISTLAQKHPHRLYIWESTARGYNLFNDMWIEAQSDPLTQKAFFIGWWAKEDYSFPSDSREYKEYWTGELDEAEQELCKEVEERYGHKITGGQIAWHRWMRTVKITDEDLMNQEYPWTEDQAFIATGKSFFPLRRISEDIAFIKETRAPLKAYRCEMGANFLATDVVQVDNTTEADLKVWEEPSPIATYAMGVDCAFGRSDTNDRHSIELYRCYADKMVQVAEFNTSKPETYQVAWVMCFLAGAYSGKAQQKVWINLEINGPGMAIMQELRNLKQLLQSEILRGAPNVVNAEVFSSVRWYMYHKPDSMSAGYVYNWKSNPENKMVIMNQLRDSYALRQVRVRSLTLLDEFQHMVQDGSAIEASGRHHDDNVVASALACKAWIEWVRPGMIERNETYERVTEVERRMQDEPSTNQLSWVIQDFFKQTEERREFMKDLTAWAE